MTGGELAADDEAIRVQPPHDRVDDDGGGHRSGLPRKALSEKDVSKDIPTARAREGPEEGWDGRSPRSVHRTATASWAATNRITPPRELPILQFVSACTCAHRSSDLAAGGFSMLFAPPPSRSLVTRRRARITKLGEDVGLKGFHIVVPLDGNPCSAVHRRIPRVRGWLSRSRDRGLPHGGVPAQLPHLVDGLQLGPKRLFRLDAVRCTGAPVAAADVGEVESGTRLSRGRSISGTWPRRARVGGLAGTGSDGRRGHSVRRAA